MTSVLRLLGQPEPSVEAARRLRAAELSRAVDELFSAVYSGDFYKNEADAFVRENDVVAHMAAAIERRCLWPHRLGVLDHGAGLLDNFFARKANYEEPQHAPLLPAMMRALDDLLQAEVTRGFHAELEGALESVLLLLGRLLARAARPLEVDEAVPLARNLALVLVDVDYEDYVGHATLHALQQLLGCAVVGKASREAVRAVRGVAGALRRIGIKKQRLSYGVVTMALACLASLRDDDGTALAVHRELELQREDLLAEEPAAAAIGFECATTATDGVDSGASSASSASSHDASDLEPAHVEPPTPAASRTSGEGLDAGFVLPSRPERASSEAAPKRTLLRWMFSA